MMAKFGKYEKKMYAETAFSQHFKWKGVTLFIHCLQTFLFLNAFLTFFYFIQTVHYIYIYVFLHKISITSFGS